MTESPPDDVRFYIVVNSDLELPIGKVCALVAHAVSRFYVEMLSEQKALSAAESASESDLQASASESDSQASRDFIGIAAKWLMQGSQMAILRATEKEIDELPLPDVAIETPHPRFGEARAVVAWLAVPGEIPMFSKLRTLH